MLSHLLKTDTQTFLLTSNVSKDKIPWTPTSLGTCTDFLFQFNLPFYFGIKRSKAFQEKKLYNSLSVLNQLTDQTEQKILAVLGERIHLLHGVTYLMSFNSLTVLHHKRFVSFNPSTPLRTFN